MGTLMEKLRGGDQALDAERRSMNEALSRLGSARAVIDAQRPPARLIIALDLTGSRAARLEEARIAMASMLDAAKHVGRVAIKAIYYRGKDEICETGTWFEDMDALSRQLLLLTCEAGGTKIREVLRRALRETEKLSGVVFIGDHCEEDCQQLIDLASELGRKSVPLFIFHECDDHDSYAISDKPQFKRMAEASGGVYAELKPDSGVALKEMLSTIAAFSAGGSRAVARLPTPVSPGAQQLQAGLRLMLGSGGPAQSR